MGAVKKLEEFEPEEYQDIPLPTEETQMVFEHMDQMDQLDQLNVLEEMNQQGALSETPAAASIVSAPVSEPLTNVQNLSPLIELRELKKLDNLKELSNLDNLSTLKELQKLIQLQELGQLDKLKGLENLTELKSLDQLTQLKDLDQLSQLKSLEQLAQLKELQQLAQLAQLKQLDKLSSVQTLGELLKEHKATLSPLVHLEKLMELVHLNDLSKLEGLNKLSQLSELDKLDKLNKIDDAHFANRLDKLDKIDILGKGTRSLVIQQFIGFGLDIFKLAILTVGIVFLLSRETGREIAVKALPALGFGTAAQVNLGLRLLINETSPEQFQAIVKDVEKRIDAEIAMVFTPGSTLKLRRRMEILHHVQSYSFHLGSVNLAENTKKHLTEQQEKLQAETVSRLEFDMSLARGKDDKETEEQLREIKLLLAQNQYPQLLEKVLPLWGSSDALTMAGVAGAAALQIKDPGTLEDILQRMPGNGAL